MTPLTRRRVLVAVGATAALGLAGCTGIDDGGADSPAGTATGTEPADSSPSPSGTATSTGTAAGPRDVTFQSTAGTEVAATRYGDGDCGVVLVPQINLDRGSWKPQASALAERGYLALAIDEDPENRWQSALGAAQYLRSEAGVSRVVLIGASSGGEAVVRATANAELSIAGVVTLSAGGGADVAGELEGEKLFVVSEDDDDRFVRVARKLHDGASEPKTLKVYAGSAHGQGIFESHGDDLRNRLYGLVDRACSG